jgi:spermidine/putrescine transport system substrate-binding protein
MSPNDAPQPRDWNPRVSRRRLLQLAGVSYLTLIAAACGSDDGESAPAALSGTVTMMNYPGWMGKTTVADFKQETGVTVKEVEGLTSGVSAAAAQIAQNKDSYDMSLGGPVLAEQLKEGDLLEEVNFDNIPNIDNVEQHFRDSYPWGPPTDFGKTGFAYRKDLISETPTTWEEFWQLAKKYPKKVTMIDYDVDTLGVALLYKGYSVNATDEAEINEARDALIEIKPNLQALLPTDFTKPLLKGTAVLASSYDYDIGAAQKQNPNVVWVAPEEGMPAYLDGWLAVKGTEKLPEVEAFMNFLLEPENYAGFINNTGSAYVMPAAEQWIDSAILDNPALKYDAAAVKTVEFEKFLGEDATKIRTRAWQEVKNA